MSTASKIHGEQHSLPFFRILSFALIGTAIMVVALKIMMGSGGSSELLKRYPWERTGKLFVYVAPEAIEDVEFLTGLAQHLRDADWCRFLFFDNRTNTPTAFPLNDEQTRHYRAKYESNAMQNIDKLVWIKIVEPDMSPPGYIEKPTPPATWTTARTSGAALAAVRERARLSGATSSVGRVREPYPDDSQAPVD